MNNAEIKIRLIEESDIPEIARVYSNSFNQVGLGSNWGKENSEAYINYCYHHQPDLFFVASAKDKLVGGIVAFVKPWVEGLDLVETAVFVDPAFQGQGAAIGLMKALLKKGIDKYKVERFAGIANGVKDFPMKWYKTIGLNPTDWVYTQGDAKEILAKLENGQNQ